MRTFILKVYGHMTPVCLEGELWDCGSEVEAVTQTWKQEVMVHGQSHLHCVQEAQTVIVIFGLSVFHFTVVYNMHKHTVFSSCIYIVLALASMDSYGLLCFYL